MKRLVRPLAVRNVLQPKPSPLSGPAAVLLLIVAVVFVVLLIAGAIR
jgi:hypothetical protein